MLREIKNKLVGTFIQQEGPTLRLFWIKLDVKKMLDTEL